MSLCWINTLEKMRLQCAFKSTQSVLSPSVEWGEHSKELVLHRRMPVVHSQSVLSLALAAGTVMMNAECVVDGTPEEVLPGSVALDRGEL